MEMNYDDGNLKYGEAVVSFAAAALDLSDDDNGYGVINLAPSTMDGIKALVDRFIAENPAANDYIAKKGNDEFGAALAVDIGGYGDGFSDSKLSEAAAEFARKANIHSLNVDDGDDGWLHIQALEG